MYLASKSSRNLLHKNFSKLAMLNKMAVKQQPKLFNLPQMSMFMVNRMHDKQRCVILDQNSRYFASGDLPPHLKLEMPNLSPTMEKVT